MSTVTYRPNGAGSNTEIASQSPGSGAHYEKVDDTSPDGATTTIYTTSATYQLDTYAFANPSESGVINNITVYVVCQSHVGYTLKSKVAIFTSGQAAQYGAENAVPSDFTEYSKAWATNPWTSVAWTWEDLNALEIGVALKADGSHNALCTQVYVVIDYTEIKGGSYAAVIGL